IGVLGLNGAGKSTLLRIMAGIDKDIEGEARPQPDIKIGYLPQNVDSALTQGPEMARVRELMYWNLDNTARSEWANLVKSKSK
ncbi:ATP-binding cassette domain-containing protein, partial [Escherichia coli]|uniref:ATP-binding cassette domain-containing protein n=1 Tax=Escherichia coli TaxID=562 RepID=UPI0022457AAB